MAKVALKVSGFTVAYKSLNGETVLEISRRELLWASVTLGFQHFGDLASADGRAWLHRLLIGLLAINSLKSEDQAWATDPFLQSLDGSDKGTLSYWSGMIFAKVVASKILRVRWLAHVDDMKAKGLLETALGTEERGDMVGMCGNQCWHVIEAKGRSNPFPVALIEKAKAQAANVTSVSGVAPATNSACIASLWRKPVEVLLDDPPAFSDGRYEMEEKHFLGYYYKNISAFIEKWGVNDSFPAGLRSYRMASFEPIIQGLPEEHLAQFSPLPKFIGLPSEIIRNPAAAISVMGREPALALQAAGDGIALLGPFGTVKEPPPH